MTISSSPPPLLLSRLVNLLRFASTSPFHRVQASDAWVGGVMVTGGGLSPYLHLLRLLLVPGDPSP